MDFLQSSVWRRIQEIVGRSIFEIKSGDQTYRGVTRSHGVGPLRVRWHQVLGVDSIDALPGLQEEIGQRFSGWNDVFFQVGVTQVVDRFSVSQKKSQDPATVAAARYKSLYTSSQVGWIPSRKENMPLATIRTPLLPRDDLYASYHKEHRRYMRKADVYNVTMVQSVNPAQWKQFYDVWTAMGGIKGVGVMSYEHFVAMMEYLTSEGVGGLFVLMAGDEVAAGSVVVFREDAVYYLYGAANRNYGNNGVHIRLQHDIMSWGHEQGYKFFDHWGVSSRATPDHHLAGVTRFKERFRGEQIEYLGNIDWVHNTHLYRLMQKRAGH